MQKDWTRPSTHVSLAAAGKGISLDLTAQLSFYGAYHRHPANKLIHFIFVPAIWCVYASFPQKRATTCHQHLVKIINITDLCNNCMS